MRIPKTTICLLSVAVAIFAFSSVSRSANAQRYFIPKTYKVQVEYWFFDTDHYYWSTVFETSDYEDAAFVYDLLVAAKDDGKLNQVVPHSYWRYFAVDVRLITVYNYRLRSQSSYAELPISASRMD